MADEQTEGLVNPFQLTDEDGYEWVKGNLHSHTTNSDGRPSPQERLDGYVHQGYDYLCLSDHDNITFLDTVACPDGFTLIQGAELHPDNPFGGQKHHFVALNLKEDMDARAMPPQHVIDAVKEQGGAIWLAHPHWSSVNILRDTLALDGLDGIEVFNTTCRVAGRGDSSVHWDDWMDLSGRLMPALANDDSHAREEDRRDTYQGWTMARVKDRSAESIVDALVAGASYGSTGPEIHDIQIRRVDTEEDKNLLFEATVKCSEALRICSVSNATGAEYWEHGDTFEEATFPLRRDSKSVRFEVIGPDGSKAWSNPFDLTGLERGDEV